MIYMSRNKFSKNKGDGFKTVICSQTGEEVTRRQSVAINYRGDGNCGSPASPCKRIKRELAPKKSKVVIEAIPSKISPKIKSKMETRLEKKAEQFSKEVSKEEINKMKKILGGKNASKKST